MNMKHFLFFVLLASLGFGAGNAQSNLSSVSRKYPIGRKIFKDAGNIDWSKWFLSVPLDRGGGKATVIRNEHIKSNKITLEALKYFFQNRDGSYTLRTRFTGYTTSGKSRIGSSKYCRTELRELWRGGKDNSDNWFMDKGTHVLESTLRVERCGGNGKIIVAQIHGKSIHGLIGSPATVKVKWDDGRLIVDYYVKPMNKGAWISSYSKKITIGAVGNEVFTIKLMVKKGKFYYALDCETKGVAKDYTFVYDFRRNGYKYANYFKTGNYFLWNEDSDKYAQVRLYNVVTRHE